MKRGGGIYAPSESFAVLARPLQSLGGRGRHLAHMLGDRRGLAPLRRIVAALAARRRPAAAAVEPGPSRRRLRSTTLRQLAFHVELTTCEAHTAVSRYGFFCCFRWFFSGPRVAVAPGSTMLNASASGRDADFPGSRGSGVSGT